MIIDKKILYGKNKFEVKRLTLIVNTNMKYKNFDTQMDCVLYDLAESAKEYPDQDVEFMILPKPIFPKKETVKLRDTEDRKRLIKKVLGRRIYR